MNHHRQVVIGIAIRTFRFLLFFGLPLHHINNHNHNFCTMSYGVLRSAILLH